MTYFISGNCTFWLLSPIYCPTNLCSIFMSLAFCLCFIFHIISEIILYLSFSDLFHLALCPWHPSLLSQMARFHSFFCGWAVSHCVYIPHCPFSVIHQWICRLLNGIFGNFHSNYMCTQLSTFLVRSTKSEMCWLKKKLHNVRVASCFIWSKMRTIAQETAFQIALTNCSKEVWGKVSIYVILVKGEYMQSSTYFLQKVS